MNIEKDKISSLYQNAINKSKLSKSPVIFSYTLTIELKTDILSLINFKKISNKTKLYWGQPSKKNQFLSIGEILSLDIDKKEKKKINTFIKDILNNSIHSNNTRQLDLPLFIGGQNFNLKNKNINIWKNYSAANYIIPELLISNNDGYHTITFYSEINKEKSFSDFFKTIIDNYKLFSDYNSNPNDDSFQIYSKKIEVTKKQFFNIFEDIKTKLLNTELEKVVLSNICRYSFKNSFPFTTLISKLESLYPRCSVFYYNFINKGVYIGASPELILKNTGENLTIDALAGSLPIGDSKSQKKENKNKMKTNIKINQEHDIVVSGIKQSLENININIKCSKKHIVKLKNIQHLKTVISAKNNDMNTLDLLDVLSPSPALSGYPKKASLDLISKIEDYDRGWYTGSIGWINNNFNCEFYAGLRSLFIHKNNIYIYGGAGITIDSNKHEEWNEILYKINSIGEIINET